MKRSWFIIIGVFIGIISTLWMEAICRESERRSVEVNNDTIEYANIIWRQNHFVLNEDNLMHELVAQEVAFPNVVLAQAVLETGHFKSHACTHRNNLFGLRRRDGAYMTFEHWTECVAAYKKYIQKWQTPPKDYYVYLDKLGYAEDKSYIQKLKQLTNDKRGN